jgi:hypothetical protein
VDVDVCSCMCLRVGIRLSWYALLLNNHVDVSVCVYVWNMLSLSISKFLRWQVGCFEILVSIDLAANESCSEGRAAFILVFTLSWFESLSAARHVPC